MNLLPQEEDDASFNTQSETNHVVNHPEFPESPDDARYLTTVMEDEDEEPLDDDDEDDVVSMPLFQYTRVMGSLPRASPVKTLAKRRYCSAMGKVILSSETMSNNNNNEETSDPSVPSPDLWHQHPIHVLAHGFEQGSLLVVDAVSGIAIADPFSVREGRNPHAVIAVSWDASGTYLAALDDGGMCAIFEIKYSIQMRDVTTSTPATGGNLLTHFMSALTRHPPTRDDGESRQRIPALTATSIQVQRIPYPSSFGKPTCVAIDPAYRKRREKSVMVGFADGRLVLTRRGFVFQRRTDAVIYQAVQDKDFAGIEAIAWRGPLVAWADSSGVRLLDVDVLQRIAHVDRPSGARSSLYPSVSRVHPSLCFETENDLLVAWGDCLLSLNIRNTDGRSSASVGDGSVVAQRRRVECKMAWELDCIACGVVPVDSRHVAVLGLVPASDDAEDEIESENRNGVELQVISRMDGAVVFADMIPLVRDEKQSHRQLESSMDFQLLSSFAVPRMDNTSEVQEMDNFGGSGANALDTLQGGMFGNGSNAGARFRDAHILWGLEHIVVEDEKILFEKDNTENKNGTADDESSVDSDEYDFALGNCSLESSSNINLSIPPIVALASSYDIVLARTRDADDAVSYALEKEKYALALHRALQHVRRLRRYNIDELVNQYFRALLRINDTADVSRLEDRSLSIRRLKIASRVMPILLGGKVDMWEHWLKELERIPGGLFIVRNAIPVRDPQLAPEVYNRMISNMLQQVYAIKSSVEARKGPKRLEIEAENQFLLSLLSWGPNNVLNEFVRLSETQPPTFFIGDIAQELLNSQKRRREQTAANYLTFICSDSVATDNLSGLFNGPSEYYEPLYDLDHVATIIGERVSWKSTGQNDTETPSNSTFALDAIALLSMMKGNFKKMLAYYMALGIFHHITTLESLEDEALTSITQTQGRKTTPDDHHGRYSFVILLIEKHHLHQYILDDSFLPFELEKSPIEALVMLVGLDCLGDFLCKHCATPQKKESALAGKIEGNVGPNQEQRVGTLPIDAVARQLERRPKLLHWYLHMISKKRPELYVKFPTTSVPPPVITDLHRKHLGLYILYAGTNRDSSKVFDGIELYKTLGAATPFLSFLKAVLPLGGIKPVEVAKLLDDERKSNSEQPGVFALELAYIMENFGNGSSEDVAMVLELYLKGARSLVLAVSYAQRAGKHSLELWHILIEYCLSPDVGPAKENSSLFGSLLEAAALSGADVALLVNQIPHGMAVEGLRPRLVAAVADYRLQLQMHERAGNISSSDRALLLSEYSHRSRRGIRCNATPATVMDRPFDLRKNRASQRDALIGDDSPRFALPLPRRPEVRSGYQSFRYALPLR